MSYQIEHCCKAERIAVIVNSSSIFIMYLLLIYLCIRWRLVSYASLFNFIIIHVSAMLIAYALSFIYIPVVYVQLCNNILFEVYDHACIIEYTSSYDFMIIHIFGMVIAYVTIIDLYIGCIHYPFTKRHDYPIHHNKPTRHETTVSQKKKLV